MPRPHLDTLESGVSGMVRVGSGDNTGSGKDTQLRDTLESGRSRVVRVGSGDNTGTIDTGEDKTLSLPAMLEGGRVQKHEPKVVEKEEEVRDTLLRGEKSVKHAKVEGAVSTSPRCEESAASSPVQLEEIRVPQELSREEEEDTHGFPCRPPKPVRETSRHALVSKCLAW